MTDKKPLPTDVFRKLRETVDGWCEKFSSSTTGAEQAVYLIGVLIAVGLLTINYYNFVLGIAGVLGIGIAVWRAIALDRQTKIAENRLLSERFATAAELMDKEIAGNIPAIAARISGIHIMADLAMANPQEFAEQVVKNMIAYIKDHAQLTAKPTLEKGQKPTNPRTLGEDVKAAFAVLNKILGDSTIKAMIDDAVLDFSHQDFSFLALEWSQAPLGHYKKWFHTNFEGARLFGADLENATMTWANFNNANIDHVALAGAHLTDVEMMGASLFCSDLRGANLRGAKLAGAKVTMSTLQGACLVGAELNGADGVAPAIMEKVQLGGARFDGVDLRGVKFKGVQFNMTYMAGAAIDDGMLSEEEKRTMNGKIWHGGAPWAKGIDECNDDEWTLEEYENYALAGVLYNFANSEVPYSQYLFKWHPISGDGKSLKFRLKARKLLAKQEPSLDELKPWHKWLNEIDPQTGEHPRDAEMLKIYDEIHP